MDWFDIFRLGCFVCAAMFHGALWTGLLRAWLRERRFVRTGGTFPEAAPLVSVIIPVHNEAACLPALLESLARQDYPQAEYIFIDDRSTDGSGELIRRFASARKGVKLITLAENPGPNRKQYALERGIGAAGGSLLLFTDGDCETPPSWIRAMTARMADPETGLVIGPVFKRRGGKGFFHLYQCFDHAVRYMYLAASTGLDAAGGGFGNNLILRREALDAAGGYGKLPPSATEDAALIVLIGRRSSGPGRWKIRAAITPDTAVITREESSWKRFVNQTLRWNNGGLFSTGLATRLSYGFLMLIISAGVLTLPFLFRCPGLWLFPAMVLFGMTINAAATLRIFGSFLPRVGVAYIPQVLFIPCYFTFLTILGLCGINPVWEATDA